MNDQNRLRKVSLVLFLLTVVMLAVHMESVIRFNRNEFQVHGNDPEAGVRMVIDPRQDSTSTWLKRSFELTENTKVNLTGQTIDGTLQNHGDAAVRDWELRINIQGDCFINQAWNGEVEIHQHAGTDREKVQRLNLQNYELEKVIFEYRFDGDLLIPLQRGDYVIYYPSERFNETSVNVGDSVRIGVIFYYLGEIDLSDYDLEYRCHREFTQGTTFHVFLVLGILWLLSAILTLAAGISYRLARKEMELRKSGIFSMSDIYDVIYIIHLPTGEMTPVSVDDKVEQARPKNKKAGELLSDMIQKESEDKYLDMMLEFVNTDTLAERLKDRSSIVSEFCSKTYGWYSIRFFAMDRPDGEPPVDVVFAVQNISEEKKELEAITARIASAESVSRSRSFFMDHVASDLQEPLEQLVTRIDGILRNSPDEAIRGQAREALGIGNSLLLLTEGLADSSGIQAGSLQPEMEDYSLRQLLTGTLRDILPLTEQRRITLETDAAETLPDRLRGDARLLREVLVNLISSVIHAAGDGRLQLAVYGKMLENKVHLMFSVRALIGQKKAAVTGNSGSVNPGKSEKPDSLNLEVASTLLKGMGSALRSVLTPADRSEFYFEIEQQVLDSSPIGKVSAEDADA